MIMRVTAAERVPVPECGARWLAGLRAGGRGGFRLCRGVIGIGSKVADS